MNPSFFIFNLLYYLSMSIITWNCQGAKCSKFKLAFKEIVMMHKPNIVAILDPCISGLQVEQVICGLGFSNLWFKDAMSFSVGILLLWNEITQISIQNAGKQLIHLEWKKGNRNGLLTMVYATLVHRTC
ncbi:hypothetical protein Syun_027836 [Stephania yunnanensis]|uniref:Uncharacterized protein n=1 Tax=Stephania yunnanensis TaxID=152371 RepID=A0AAP0HRL8_9MAGN